MTETVWEQSFSLTATRSRLPAGYTLQVIDGVCYRWIDYNKTTGEWSN